MNFRPSLLGGVVLLVCLVHLRGEVYNFGSTILGQQQSSPQFDKRIYLLPNYATDDGYIFALSAVVSSQDPAMVIVYRPQVKCSLTSLKPVGHIVYNPSASAGWRENVYLESFFKDGGCVPVKKNDMIGLYFPSRSPSILYSFWQPSNNFDTTRKCSDGVLTTAVDAKPEFVFNDVTFDRTIRPAAFEIEVFFYTSAQNSSTSMCQKGISIPSNRTATVHPSTTTPNYKGAVGLQGLPGPKGPVGNIGFQGETGKLGDAGVVGDLGVNGYTGPSGARGPIGLSGDIGPPGLTGLVGAKGPQGANGSEGDTGVQGEIGPPGLNYTVNLLKKPPAPPGDSSPEGMSTYDYFATDRATWALFIWLAILSLIGLSTFVLLLVTGVIVSKL